MRSRIGVDIAAPPALVFELVRDVGRWERLLPHYARSRIRDRHDDGSVVADFIARRPLIAVLGLGLPVAWRSRVWADPTRRRLRFVHVAGATRGMDVTWTIEPGAAGTRVEIDHDFRPRIPGFARFVDRWFTRPIAGRTLGTVRDLAETLAAGQSGSPPPTNTSS
jgi:ribosome-associated toxin RatA of RatAB toxin-antitoxin module